MEILIVLPILLPIITAIIQMSFNRHLNVQRIINVIAAFIQFGISIALFMSVYQGGIFSITLGSWPAPFGISFAADMFSAVMVLITGIISLTSSVYSIATVPKRTEIFFYYPLMQILIMGINGSFLTADIFNLFVWFEVMLISSFVLVALGGKKEQLEGAIKYVTINLISSSLFLAAVGILFGIAGSLNMADLAVKLPQVEQHGLIYITAALFLVSFGIKSAIFPLFFWLPASYHTPPAAVSAFFAGMLTKVGVYALYRVFTLLFNHDNEFTNTILLAVAGMTMLVGVLGAAAQNDFRRILSFHIISQIGYMILGLALYTPLAIAGGIFYIIHHIIVKANLFLISGAVNEIKGSYNLGVLGGVFKYYPLLGLLFLVPAMSLGGIPPLSGFWAKYTVVKAGLEVQEWGVIIVALVVGLLTLFSMTKIWNEVFWKDAPNNDSEKHEMAFAKRSINMKIMLFAPIVFLAAITVVIGIFPEPFFRVAQMCSEQLLNPQQYIEAVLGK